MATEDYQERHFEPTGPGLAAVVGACVLVFVVAPMFGAMVVLSLVEPTLAPFLVAVTALAGIVLCGAMARRMFDGLDRGAGGSQPSVPVSTVDRRSVSFGGSGRQRPGHRAQELYNEVQDRVDRPLTARRSTPLSAPRRPALDRPRPELVIGRRRDW